MQPPSPTPDDRLVELMEEYQRGSMEAFEALYHQLRPRLDSFFLFQVRDRLRVDDLVQETFLQLHRSRATYLPGRPVTPWVLAIARHVHLADRRRRGRRDRRESPAPDPWPEIPVPDGIEQIAARDLLQRAMIEVPEAQREAMLMHHVHGLSFAEVGSLLGVRAGTAKLRAHRALKRLREIAGRLRVTANPEAAK